MKPRKQSSGVWKFFFDETAPDTLCVFRILFGVFLVAALALMTPVVLRTMVEGGPIPLTLARREIGDHTITLLTFVRSFGGVLTLHLIAILAAAAMAAGLWTGMATLIVYLIYMSYMNGALYIWDGGDGVISILLFLMTLAGLAGHSGAAYSLDAFLAKKSNGSRKTTIPAWPIRMLQLQLCVIYFFSAWYKTQYADWQNGEALHYVFNQLAFATVPMAWMSAFPIFIALLTYGILFLELSFPFLVWMRPFKAAVLWAMFAMHLFIRLTMHVFAFTVMLPYLIVFVEPTTVRRWVKRFFAFA